MKKYYLATVTPAINEHAAAGTQLTDAISFPAGTILYGRWTSVTLHTGTAIAYSIN